MINRKWIIAGYAAALTSILLVVILLGNAFLTETRGGGERENSSRAESAAYSDGEETVSSNGDTYDEGEGRSEEAFVQEQSDLLSTAMGQADYGAEILTLSGKELWNRFDGAVLTGDSRVVGFSLYTNIPDSNVLARNGATIDALDGFIPQIAALKPERVYVAYGINDIKSAVGGKTAKSYAGYAEEKIGRLEEELEDAEIYVNSILPVSPLLEKKDRDYRKVTEYNKELRDMCLRRGWHYIDNSAIAVKYADLYVSDGVHLQAGFYEHWGRNMLIVQAGVHIDEGGTGVDR